MEARANQEISIGQVSDNIDSDSKVQQDVAVVSIDQTIDTEKTPPKKKYIYLSEPSTIESTGSATSSSDGIYNYYMARVKSDLSSEKNEEDENLSSNDEDEANFNNDTSQIIFPDGRQITDVVLSDSGRRFIMVPMAPPSNRVSPEMRGNPSSKSISGKAKRKHHKKKEKGKEKNDVEKNHKNEEADASHYHDNIVRIALADGKQFESVILSGSGHRFMMVPRAPSSNQILVDNEKKKEVLQENKKFKKKKSHKKHSKQQYVAQEIKREKKNYKKNTPKKNTKKQYEEREIEREKKNYGKNHKTDRPHGKPLAYFSRFFVALKITRKKPEVSELPSNRSKSKVSF